MTTIIDHARNATSPLRADASPADALALAALSYVDFHALPGPRSARGCLLREVARASSVRALYRHSLATHSDRPLLEAVGSSPRFRGVRVRDAITRIGAQPLAQFGALTFVDEAGAAYVVFRGTDASAVGWAEDTRFGLHFPTIAQRWAARYLSYAARRTSQPVTVIGHSKGGNLALYAAAALHEAPVGHVHAFDPVGFPEAVIDDGFFAAIAPRTSVYTTAVSWVSPLFPLPTGASVIASLWPGPASHNPYTWLVDGPGLLRDPRPPSRSGAALGDLVRLALRIRPIRVHPGR